MPIYEEFVKDLSQCTPEAFKEIGWYLYTNDATILSFPTQCNLHLQKYSISCLSDGNSKIYKVTNVDESESFILKLESWSMPQEIQQRFDNNDSLASVVAPVYFNKRCTINQQTMHIQIQPFCRGGTLESAARKQMSDEERIDHALMLYKQVASFYIELQQENILFPDGKPSNFTLDENGNLQLTDMKTYVESSIGQLEHCAQINTTSYPLYIPMPPPRQRDEVHARHFGMNLYAYLTGRKWDDFYAPHSNLMTPLPTAAYTYNNPIFQSDEGRILASLIQNMIADYPAKRPSVGDAQKILNLVSNVRAVRSQNKEDADAKIIATYHEFFVTQPTLLRLVNATMVKDWVTNGVVNPDDAVKAFPHNAEIISVALAKNPTSWKHANSSIVKDLVNDGKINPDAAVQAFPHDTKIIHAALVKQSTSLQFANTTMVKKLLTKGVVKPEDAVKAFPENQEIIQAALHEHLLTFKAIVSWYPTDKALISYEKQIGTELKDFNQLSQIIKILRSPAYRAIIAEIKQLRQKSTFVTTNPFTWFQRGDDMLNRANRLEQALYNLPLEERGNTSIETLLSTSAASNSTLQQKTAQDMARICDSKEQGTDPTPPDSNTRNTQR